LLHSVSHNLFSKAFSTRGCQGLLLEAAEEEHKDEEQEEEDTREKQQQQENNSGGGDLRNVRIKQSIWQTSSVDLKRTGRYTRNEYKPFMPLHVEMYEVEEGRNIRKALNGGAPCPII
jgi:hypothetical protein